MDIKDLMNSAQKIHWSAEEDETFSNLYQLHGKQFDLFLIYMPGRTVSQIRSHFYNLQYKLTAQQTNINKYQENKEMFAEMDRSNKWSKSETVIFAELYKLHGKHLNSYLVSLPNKKYNQIRYMYEKQKAKITIESSLATLIEQSS